MEYQEFLEKKRLAAPIAGFEVRRDRLNSKLFEFQKDIVQLALKVGRFCNWSDCGLGKGFMALEWAHQVCKRTKGKVLILAPLAVSRQFELEAQKLGVKVKVCASQADVVKGINITNYEKLDKFDPDEFIGVVCDEASILKSYDGKTCRKIIDAFRNTPYKFACSATPSPNDHMELGTQAEFLGVMTRTEMLSMFFTHDGGDTSKWRLKGHAQDEFWKWVCTWAAMVKRPSDLGYDDGDFVLPALNMHPHTTQVEIAPADGLLFVMEARSLSEQRVVRKQSLEERCAIAAELALSNDEQWVIWCNLNEESSTLKSMISDAVEVKGSDSDEHKSRAMIDFSEGRVRVLISKASICGFGMNWQNCHNTIVFPSHSYESFYQLIRRFWRFGQTKAVNCHLVYDELEGAVITNLQRKEADADRMAEQMAKHMRDTTIAMLGRSARFQVDYNPVLKMEIPQWLMSA